MSVITHTVVAMLSLFIAYCVGYYMGVQKIVNAYLAGTLQVYLRKNDDKD